MVEPAAGVMTHYRKDLVLVGGGHTHVLAIKALAMRPIPGLRITLVSEQTLTPYSGMLPAYVAGHYQKSEMLIDLNRLCVNANVRWIHARVTGLRLADNILQLKGQADIEYDLVSLDIGSGPNLNYPGAAEHAVGVKPISWFHSVWESLCVDLHKERAAADIGVVGAGIAGTELSLAIAHRLVGLKECTVHLLYPQRRIMPGLPERVAKTAERELQKLGVKQHPGFELHECQSGGVVASNGEFLALNYQFICTDAVPAAWPKDSGLATDERGFISVNASLQSISHGNVFAAGDIAHLSAGPRPKAGVFAVRQAPILVDNLRRYCAGQALREVELQSDFLRLISLGRKEAIAYRSGLTLSGAWVWRWKDWIDRRFMRQFDPAVFQTLMPNQADSEAPMHCAACGSKLGPNLVASNLNQLAADDTSSVQVALGRSEDAVIWQPQSDICLAQSLDGFRSFTGDLYQFGRISVNHALSDLYAMGAAPVHAQAWLNLAFADLRLQQRDHLRVMQGVTDALQAQGAVLSGGHSTEGMEDHLGIVANGEVVDGEVWTKGGARRDDVLLLSKPLGTGVILAANMMAQAPAQVMDLLMRCMLDDNYRLFDRLRDSQPNAVTDVSGFGLLGHLFEMLDQAGVGAELHIDQVPFIDGAAALAADGHHSSLQPSLRAYLARCDNIGIDEKDPRLQLLIDPQTSGGLLIALPENHAQSLLNSGLALWKIGRIVEPQSLLILSTA